MAGEPPALQLIDVSRRFGKRLWALDQVSLTVPAGQTLGVVGESGSGKSTIANLAVGLDEPTSGEVVIGGYSAWEARGRHLSQMVFQDPSSSLDPLMRVARSVAEPLGASSWGDRARRLARASELLDEVGLGAGLGDRLPSALSGGQKQRASIGRSLTTLPPLVVCDEAVTALDVSIRAQILNLLRRLQAEHSIAYLFISHDLSTVSYMSDRVLVLYLGRVMEHADTARLLAEPAHPYTHALLSAVPAMQQGSSGRVRLRLVGDPPSALDPPPGCRFQTRCPLAEDRCRQEAPALREVRPGQFAACHLAPVDAEDLHGAQALSGSAGS